MCSRFENTGTPRDLADRFGLPGLPPHASVGELRPTDMALTIGPGPEAIALTWGVPAPWSGQPLINARSETLGEKPTFRPLLSRRCLVPATAYFEWRKVGRARLRNRIAPAGVDLFAFAGLTDGRHFTIVTCAPAATIAHIHNRMPVILAREAEAVWLDSSLPFAEVAGVLTPFADPLTAEEHVPTGHQGDLFG